MVAGDTVGSKFNLDPSDFNNGALDATGTGTIAGATSGTVAITTAVANTVIFVFVGISSNTKVSTVTDTRSLTYYKLAGLSNSTSVRGEVWWAYEPTAQSHTITVTLAASGNAGMIAGNLSGLASTVIPNGAVASGGNSLDPQTLAGSTGTGTAVSLTSTNMNPADIFIGFVACTGNTSRTVGSGYTTINSTNQSTNVSVGAEYQTFTASALQTVNYTLGSSVAYVLIGFALISNGGASGGTNIQTVQPAAAVEEVIHNVEGSTSFGVLLTDGVNPIKIDSVAGEKWDMDTQIHLTNTQYMVIVNIHATNPGTYGWDGVQTK